VQDPFSSGDPSKKKATAGVEREPTLCQRPRAEQNSPNSRVKDPRNQTELRKQSLFEGMGQFGSWSQHTERTKESEQSLNIRPP
jgi:hypothetical protein